MNSAIDFHCHTFPDNVAPKALAFLEGKSGIKPSFDGTMAGLLRSMNDAGIEISVNMPVATNAEQVSGINRYLASMKRNPRIVNFAAFHPNTANIKETICEIRKAGFPGIKLHPEFQNFSPDEEHLFSLWDACVENNLLVLFHAGADFAFSPPFKSSPAKFAKLHMKYPELKMILAHFGSWKMWDETEKELLGLPIYLETSFTLSFLDENRFIEMVRKHGAEKILFGTDAPWGSQKDELMKINAVALSDAEKEMITRKNAALLLANSL